MNNSIMNISKNWLNHYQKIIGIGLFLLSAILILIGKYHHEMWLDEWQSVGIARSANGFIDLWKLRRYEGHPYLYFAILYIWNLLAQSNTAIVLLHSIFSIGAMYVLLVKSNFSVVTKLLLLFSIYFMWKYTVINRVYCVCLFFIFLYTYLLHQQKLPFGISISLFTILCQLDAYSAAIALLLGGYYYFSSQLSFSKNIIFAIIGILNFLLLYISIKQPLDATATYSNVFHFDSLDITHLLRYFNFSFISHHNYSYNQWNNLYLFDMWVVYVLFIIIAISIFYSITNVLIRICMGLALIGLVYINLQIGANTMRHIGFYWVVYICALWLDSIKKIQRTNYFFIICMLIQAFWGLRIYILDARHPFSLMPKAMAYLKQYFVSNHVFVGYGGMSVSGPSAYLGTPIINIKSKRQSRFYNWNAAENISSQENSKENIESLNQIFTKYGKSILIITKDNQSYAFVKLLNTLAIKQNTSIKKMPEYGGSIEVAEDMYLYKIDSIINL